MTCSSRFSIMLIAFLAVAGSSQAQITYVQTVQLPTFHVFGVSTTVVVPARGTIGLGAVRRFSSAQTPFDRVGNRGRGYFASSNNLSLSATVIDNAEIDRALLAEAARRRGDDVDVLGRRIDPQLHEVESRDFTRAAADWRRAKQAEATGQLKVAELLYRRVVSRGSAQQQRLAEQRLARLQRD